MKEPAVKTRKFKTNNSSQISFFTAYLTITISILTTFFLLTMSFSLLTHKALAVNCRDLPEGEEREKCEKYEEEQEELEEGLEETQKKVDTVNEDLTDIRNRITNLSNQLNITQEEINSLQVDINEVKQLLEDLSIILEDRREKLSDKIDLRNKIVRNYSKKNILSDLELFFSFSAGNQETNGTKNQSANLLNNLSGFQLSTLTYAFNKSASQESLRLIQLLNIEISDYENDKKETEELKSELETEQNRLLAIKADLDSKKASAAEEEEELEEKKEEYEEEIENLQQEIEELSQKQQSILAAKFGNEYGSVGEYEPPESKTPDPPFKPAFAAFSYGAYTHYKGMSQYGAKGRADDGKSYKDIIKFYYKQDVKEKDDFPDEICVEGYGDMDFQKYLYGIAEMPSDWPDDALKAQAIAARSYAYRYEKQGKCICTSQSCQVFLKSKADKPPEKWKKAVDDTEGKIVGGDVVAYYSSTTGGYIDSIGWDTKGSWPGDAYEKRAKSPWFRKAWYTKSYNDSSNCGRSHPWMTPEEMADILNAWVVWRKGSGSEKDHISPVTTSCWGGDPYSNSEMKEKADKYGEAYSKVTDIDVDISNGGYTSKVTLKTDRGTVLVDGDVFKTVYNLRAPSYIAIRSRLYDFDSE